jgi:hypothetical protein
MKDVLSIYYLHIKMNMVIFEAFILVMIKLSIFFLIITDLLNIVLLNIVKDS